MVQYCEKCGEKLEDNDTFCTACGNKTINIEGVQEAKNRKNKYKRIIIICIILFFVGFIGMVLTGSSTISIIFVDLSGFSMLGFIFAIILYFLNTVSNSKQYSQINREQKKVNRLNTFQGKFDSSLNGKYWFECTIEEVRNSTFTNSSRRNVDHAIVIVEDNYLEIFKESVVLKSNMGQRKIFFKNLAAIDFDTKGKLHASDSLVLKFISSEEVILKNIHKKDVDEIHKRYDNYILSQDSENKGTTDVADQLLKWNSLYEKGIITEEEFETKKKELL